MGELLGSETGETCGTNQRAELFLAQTINKG